MNKMELKIISDIENPLFNRREIEGELEAQITPSRKEVEKILSEKFSVQPECIKIRTIKGKFGKKIFLIVANIYSSKQEKDKTEFKKKKDIEAEKKTLKPEKIQDNKEIAESQEDSGDKEVIKEKIENKSKQTSDEKLINKNKSETQSEENSAQEKTE